MITLFGATGFTGRLIAAELSKSGQPFRLAGRSSAKLKALSNSLESKPEWLVADATQISSLPALFKDNQVLINCAGPFTDLGERIIAQAAMSGSGYLDVSNELGYVYRAYSYDAMARKTGAVIVPACGFEVALADCMAHMLVSQIRLDDPDTPFDEIDVIYRLDGKGSSAGTRKSIIRSLATSWIAYRNGEWTGEMPGRHTQKLILPSGQVHALSIPSCESMTIPAHLPVSNVRVWLVSKPAFLFFAQVLIPLTARLSRSIARPLLLRIATQGGYTPDDQAVSQERSASQFQIDVRCKQGKRKHWITLTGKDPYGVTAKIATFTAITLLSSRKSELRGMLAPAQTLDPSTFLQTGVRDWGLKITTT